MTDVRRGLPAVHTLLEDERFEAMIQQHSRSRVADAIRGVLDEIRAGHATIPASTAEWCRRTDDAIRAGDELSLVRVINATGVILHTNLGRAPLARAAQDAIARVAAGYATVEFDLATGARGARHPRGTSLLRALTGADDALVINNCASALLLALRALASGRDVLVSRGELIEIGGSFRVPEIMAQADVRLVEIGTTNRTHLDDYRRALTPETGAIVKVHRSNFTMQGFVRDVPARDLAHLAAEAGIPLIHDLGSGLMVDLSALNLRGEPTARDAVAEGADVIVMSGDKLLGGPQAGIVLGKAPFVARMRAHPVARAVRTDKLTMAALEATLALYRSRDVALRDIPVLRMIASTRDELRARAESLAARVAHRGRACTIAETGSVIGGGAFPTALLPSFALQIAGDAPRIEESLRHAPVPVIGRIVENAVLLDVRTLLDGDDDAVVDAVSQAANE